MDIDDILDPRRTRLDVEAASKKRVLETLSEVLAGSMDGEEAPDAHAVFEGLFAREKLGSTGLGHGVALPHARLSGVARPIGALLRLGTGVDFDAPDRGRVDLVFGLLVPEDSTSEHLQLLAQLASRFSDEQLRDALRGIDTPDHALRLMTGAETPG